MMKFFKNIDGYIFYRIYIQVLKRRPKEEAFDTSKSMMFVYHILYIEILFFISEGILDFDMAPVTGYYIQNKKYIILTAIPVLFLWLKIEEKYYKKKLPMVG